MNSCSGCEERGAQIDELKMEVEQWKKRALEAESKLSLKRDASFLSSGSPPKKAKKPKMPKSIEKPKESALQKAIKKIVERDDNNLPVPRDDDKHYSDGKVDKGYVMCPGKLADRADSCGVLIASQPAKLDAHLNTTVLHGNEASFKCSKCDEKFSGRQQRIDHYNTVHLGVVYKCQYEGCEDRELYKSSTGLHKHIEVQHKGTKYQCTVDNCSKIFNSSGGRIYSDQLELFLADDEETINQAKDDVQAIMDLFKDGAKFEEQGSGNYIQYLDNDAETLADALPFFNYAGTETPRSQMEGSRARDHDNEFKSLLEGKIENPTEKLLKMKEAHLGGKEIKYVHFGQNSYSALAFARESAIIIAIGLHNLSNSIHGKTVDNVFGFMGEGIERRKRIAGIGAYWLNEMFNQNFST